MTTISQDKKFEEKPLLINSNHYMIFLPSLSYDISSWMQHDKVVYDLNLDEDTYSYIGDDVRSAFKHL